MISWNNKSISTLYEIVSYLKKHLGLCLEQLAHFYMDRHSLLLNINQYSMGFSQEYIINTDIVDDGLYKLAFICELGYIIECMNLNKKHINYDINNEEIYKYVSYMIKFSIEEIFELSPHKLKHSEFFLLSILKNVLISDVNISKPMIKTKTKIKIGKDKDIDVISVAYFLVLELIKAEKLINIYQIQSTLLQTQILDINILSKPQIKAITEILNNKRKLFVRLLLVLSYQMIKYKYTKQKIISTINFKNRDQMIACFSIPIIETVIYLTSYYLSFKNNQIRKYLKK